MDGVPAVAFDGVFADVELFAPEEPAAEGGEVSGEGEGSDEAADGGLAVEAGGVGGEVYPAGVVVLKLDGVGELEEVAALVFVGEEVALADGGGELDEAFDEALDEGSGVELADEVAVFDEAEGGEEGEGEAVFG